MNETPRAPTCSLRPASSRPAGSPKPPHCCSACFGGEPEPRPAPTRRGAAIRRTQPVIDLTPETLEVDRTAAGTRRPGRRSGPASATGRAGGTAATAQRTMPEALRSFLERFNGSGLEAGLGGLTGRWRRRHPTSCRTAPGSSPDPTATRPAAAPTSSTCPAPITGRHCRWWSCCTAAPSRPTTSPPARG